MMNCFQVLVGTIFLQKLVILHFNQKTRRGGHRPVKKTPTSGFEKMNKRIFMSALKTYNTINFKNLFMNFKSL